MRWFEWWKRKPTIEPLVWSVRRAVYSDARFRDFEAPRIGIAADAGSGQIILTGAVSTPETRNLAERAARRADGVVTFRNELRTDADLTRQLRSLLATDLRTRGLGTRQ